MTSDVVIVLCMQPGALCAISYCRGICRLYKHRRCPKNCQLKGEIMADHDANFRDSSGPIWFVINLAAMAWITMPVPIALITILKW